MWYKKLGHVNCIAVITVCPLFIRKEWYIIQRQRSSSASSARSTQHARLHRHHVAKNAIAHLAVVVTIESNSVSRVVLNQFLDVQRRHQRRSPFVSHASPAREQHATASADWESSNGQSKRRRNTQNQHGKNAF